MSLRPFAEIGRTTILISPIVGGGAKFLVSHFFTCLVRKRSYLMYEKQKF
jgi:hypothetical protein